MATINKVNIRSTVGLDSSNVSVWHVFSPEVERQLREEDRAAGRAVCGVLITIVTLGLLIGIVAVILAA
jgi:hypothetical protein